MEIEKGIIFEVEPKIKFENEDIEKVDKNVIESDKFFLSLRKLLSDFGLEITKYGSSENMKKAICKGLKKEWQELAFDEGVQQAFLNMNKAENSQTPFIKPLFNFDEINKQ